MDIMEEVGPRVKMRTYDVGRLVGKHVIRYEVLVDDRVVWQRDTRLHSQQAERTLLAREQVARAKREAAGVSNA